MRRDNETWVSDLASGGSRQQAALADLREELLRGLRGAVSSRTRADESVLEDAVQDALLRILDRLGQFQGRSRFTTWATAIAIRVAMSELRRRRWKDVSFEELIAEGGIVADVAVDDTPRPDARWERRSILEAMHRVIHGDLTDKQRGVLLAELRGMPQDEIARHLGSTRNAVYKLTHDARRRLKKGLQAAGYEAADIESAFAR